MGINIVLYEPEIPQNTGNIMRTCIATNTTLHLIEPLGFKLDEKAIKRSGVNYIPKVKYIIYKNITEFYEKNPGEYFYLTRYGQKSFFESDLKDPLKNYYFFIGRESTGIPYPLLKENFEHCYRIPMADVVRTLNVSNVAAIVIYEALRQQGFPNLSFSEPETMKGKDFLLK
ncbi:MAG: tRNA (cytidine(34)-2'-O)-methyltransferase [Bacilli bacterium]